MTPPASILGRMGAVEAQNAANDSELVNLRMGQRPRPRVGKGSTVFCGMNVTDTDRRVVVRQGVR
jgi:hypothetical protein